MKKLCCKTSVHPLDMDLAVEILETAMFTPVGLPGESTPLTWRRHVPEENANVLVTLNGGFELRLVPAITAYDHHAGKRIAASIYFEIAAKYAEKIGGEILQNATVPGCRPTGSADLLVARYPDLPMTFDHVCPGFKEVLGASLWYPGEGEVRGIA